MNDINYDALAKAAYEARGHNRWDMTDEQGIWKESARAVVAAYREQQRARGVVEVRADTVNRLVDWIEQTRYHVPASTNVIKALVEADAALAGTMSGLPPGDSDE